MNTVTCVICGTRKGGANNWWVLLEAESERVVLIGPIDDAEKLREWKPGAAQFDLCGVECLYRKLNGVLLPAVSIQAGGEKPSRILPAADARTMAARPVLTPNPLRGILGLARNQKRTGPEWSLPSSDTTAARNEKIASPKLRENSAIGQGVTITGEIESDEPLYVNGHLAGTLELPGHRLTVGPSGAILANVRAREVEVFGVLEGDVRADKIVIRKNARLAGDICTVTLVIEEGAFFVGNSSKAPARDTSSHESLRQMPRRNRNR